MDGTHGEGVAARVERDRGALLALPAVAYLVVQRTSRRVARDGMFSFEGRRYTDGDVTESTLAPVYARIIAPRIVRPTGRVGRGRRTTLTGPEKTKPRPPFFGAEV